jgi:hypothetical protein
MSGDDVRTKAAKSAAAPSDDLCDKLAESAKDTDHISGAMTVVLRAPTQTGQI